MVTVMVAFAPKPGTSLPTAPQTSRPDEALSTRSGVPPSARAGELLVSRSSVPPSGPASELSVAEAGEVPTWLAGEAAASVVDELVIDWLRELGLLALEVGVVERPPSRAVAAIVRAVVSASAWRL